MKLTVLFIIIMLNGCTISKVPDSELSDITHDVLRGKEGVDIRITPIAEERASKITSSSAEQKF